jgi:hypothetical protein
LFCISLPILPPLATLPQPLSTFTIFTFYLDLSFDSFILPAQLLDAFRCSLAHSKWCFCCTTWFRVSDTRKGPKPFLSLANMRFLGCFGNSNRHIISTQPKKFSSYPELTHPTAISMGRRPTSGIDPRLPPPHYTSSESLPPLRRESTMI